MKTIFRAWVLALMCLCLGYGVPAAAQTPSTDSAKTANAQDAKAPALAAALDALLEKAVAEQRLVGAVMLVAKNGKVIYSKAAGYADREKRQPMREKTIFRLSSVSKPFTVMAAAALVHQGKLHLDDPVTTWLPEFAPRMADGTQPVITIRQLFAHTAGLTYTAFEDAGGPYHRAGVSDGIETSGISLEENLRRIGSAPLLFQPGTRWNYSLATDVLGAVVAQASGLPLPEAVQVLVTRPLGMRDTGFTVTDTSRLAVPYYTAEPRPLPMKENESLTFEGMTFVYAPGRALDPHAFPSGGGGMVGTAPEVLRLLETIRLGGAPLVGAELMQAMNTNQIGDHRSSPGTGFGLGWAVLVDPAEAATPQSAGTLSWGGVYGHSWFVDPAQGLSVVLLTNTAPEGLFGAIVNEVRDAIYAHLP